MYQSYDACYHCLLILKRSIYHILCSWLLLFLFAAGQIVIYSHQHTEQVVVKVHDHQTSHQNISGKCQLCDAMHHNAMVINVHNYSMPVQANQYSYQDPAYDFVSISLILAAGRAPPFS